MVAAVNDRLKIAIDYVDEIERTERGKLRLIARSVPPEDVVGRELLPPLRLSALENGGGAGP